MGNSMGRGALGIMSPTLNTEAWLEDAKLQSHPPQPWSHPIL